MSTKFVQTFIEHENISDTMKTVAARVNATGSTLTAAASALFDFGEEADSAAKKITPLRTVIENIDKSAGTVSDGVQSMNKELKSISGASDDAAKSLRKISNEGIGLKRTFVEDLAGATAAIRNSFRIMEVAAKALAKPLQEFSRFEDAATRMAPLVGGRSRLITCGMAQTFQELDALRERWRIQARFVFVDGSFETQRVAEWCARTGATMLMGDRVAGRASFLHSDKRERVYSPRRFVHYAGKTAASYYFSNLSCKDKLAQLRAGQAQPWELPKDVPVNYLKQLQSEYRSLTASGKPIWLKRGSRANHYWDCEVMQVAAAYLMKII